MRTLLALIPLLVAFDLLGGIADWHALTRCEPGSTPSSLTFGYSELRPGSTASCLSANTFAGFLTEKVDLFFQAGPAMLLYWNGLKTTAGTFAGKRVLIGQGYPASVYAYDLDTKKILWRHTFVESREEKQRMPINSAAPVISAEHQRIYGTYIEETFKNGKPTGSRLTQHYYSIGLDGSGPEEFSVDLAKFVLEKGTAATADEIHKYLRCRTALGLNTQADPPYVFSGCSIVRAFSFEGSQFVHESSSQSTKGVRGVLLALSLDKKTGRFNRALEPRHFLPSRLGPAPDAGVDAGIWHSGGAPALLPGNKLLLATGNGAYRPASGLYGCSVLLLDGNKLNVEHSYFSAKGKPVEEASRICHEGNLDVSSSSPATLLRNGRFYSAIGGKDGWLKVFDPYQLNSATETQVSDSYLFGQPILWPTAITQVALGGNTNQGSRWIGFRLQDNFKLEKRWEISSPFARAYNTSAAGSYFKKGKSPILFIPLRSGKEGEVFRSALQVVDVNEGRVLEEVPFEGITHFSMPTVIDDMVFVPTAEHGIYRFTAKRGLGDFMRGHTFLGRLLAR